MMTAREFEDMYRKPLSPRSLTNKLIEAQENITQLKEELAILRKIVLLTHNN
jgi:hypothetical protein